VFFRRGVSSKDDPWVAEKIWVFTVGALVAMVGMLLENPWLMGAAALLLLGGILLRFIPRGGDSDEGGPTDRDGGAAGGDGPLGPG
jgi:hypothetical protein